MLILLIEILKQKGVISKYEADTIQSLAALQELLESRLCIVLTKEETGYIDNINKYIKEGKIEELKNIFPPRIFKGIHKKITQFTNKLGVINVASTSND